jgi:biopolymer transport protein ExbD
MSLLASKQDDQVMAEINITPFTDVLLVLLIIFMILAALITPPGFEKQLPNKNSNPSVAQNNPKKEIDVEVNNKGVIFLDGKRTDTGSLYYAMSQEVVHRGRLHVSITADAKAPYGIIIRILDAARLSGLEDVGFVTS